MHGLGYDQGKAYAFMGISQATGYLMPILGGYMADQVLGLRRSILFGSVFLVVDYLLIMLSGLTITSFGDKLFLIAYAMIPAANSLLMGTASAMVSRVYHNEDVKAKSAMTFYYMAINVGGLLATVIAPSLLESRYGPLSVLALTFVGKAIAATNFAARYSLYDPIVAAKDQHALSKRGWLHLIGYLTVLYGFTLFAYSHIVVASVVVSIGCVVGIIWFVIQSCLLSGVVRIKQLIAILLIVEAIIFFVVYNQMNTTLILFAKYNSLTQWFGLSFSPAHYQLLNPLLIIILGMYLPRFYRRFPGFSIPYQFASGTLLASAALIIIGIAPATPEGMIHGGFIALTYVLITLAELWVSAIGLSMIGLYCDVRMLGFAMGAWYLASSLSNILSGHIAQWVALPAHMISPLQSLSMYQRYYEHMGWVVFGIGVVMICVAYLLHQTCHRREIKLA